MREKLCDKYQNEREDICRKLIDIIQLDESHSFLLCELDGNLEKQTAILNMKEEIQKYFACSTISSFRKNVAYKRPYLNLIRGILKQQHYTFERNEIEIPQENGRYFRSTKYQILRGN
jgi:hypothetical protein